MPLCFFAAAFVVVTVYIGYLRPFYVQYFIVLLLSQIQTLLIYLFKYTIQSKTFDIL